MVRLIKFRGAGGAGGSTASIAASIAICPKSGRQPAKLAGRFATSPKEAWAKTGCSDNLIPARAMIDTVKETAISQPLGIFNEARLHQEILQNPLKFPACFPAGPADDPIQSQTNPIFLSDELHRKK